MRKWSLELSRTIVPTALKIRRHRYPNGDRKRAEVLISCPLKSRVCIAIKPRWVDVGSLLKTRKPGSCRACGVFKGGYVTPQGYVLLTLKRRGCKVLEHRLIMEEALGRKLCKNETVHHKNGNRADNRLKNLELFLSAHGPGQRIRDLRRYLQTVPKKFGGLK